MSRGVPNSNRKRNVKFNQANLYQNLLDQTRSNFLKIENEDEKKCEIVQSFARSSEIFDYSQ